MMSSIEILNSMCRLIKENEGESYWFFRLKKLADNQKIQDDDFRLAIKQLFGGMGTLNDIAITDGNGNYPLEANEEFERLKKELRNTLREAI